MFAYALASIAFWLQMVGGGWDIEFHLAGGAEEFWTPPHMLLYVGIGVSVAAALNGLLLNYIGSPVPGLLRLGLGVVLVGGAVELGAGVFDSWWHATWGIDDAFSPPHVMMILGMNVVGVGLVTGLAVLLRARDFWRSVSWRGRRLASRAAAAAGAGWLFALLGIVWIFSHPEFQADPFLPELWQRALVALAFSGVLAFALVAVRGLHEVRWGATSMSTLFGLSILAIFVLIGRDIPRAAAELPLFIGSGLLVDAVLPRMRSRGASWRVAGLIGAILGTAGVVLLRMPSEDMTGGLEANPPLFLAAYALGGVLGALGGQGFSTRMRAEAGVPAPRPTV